MNLGVMLTPPQAYMAIPFLWELRAILDWTVGPAPVVALHVARYVMGYARRHGRERHRAPASPPPVVSARGSSLLLL